jgi:transmembrane sensor
VGRGGADEDEPSGGATHGDPITDEALEWFLRLRDAEPDPRILGEFEAWLARDPRHETEYRALEAMWGSRAFAKALRTFPSAGTSVHCAAAVVRRRGVGAGWKTGIAAAVAAVFLTVGVWQYPKLMLSWQADYITEAGHQSTVRLADGSTMTLNTASAVALDFDQGYRTVRLLQGEAFFDVKHDASRPFRVEGHFGEVEVTGTAFSVRTGQESDEIVLERGRVEVTCFCATSKQVELHPGEMVTATATALSAVRPVDPSRALAWREGRIIFEEQPLGTVLAELQRYYDGRIIVMDSRASGLVVTGNYRLDDIEGAIRTLADAAGVGMTRIPGGFIILR